MDYQKEIAKRIVAKGGDYLDLLRVNRACRTMSARFSRKEAMSTCCTLNISTLGMVVS
jgi:hypothetical protein